MCTLRYLIDKSNRTQRLEGILLKKSLRYRLEYKLSTTDSCKNFCSPHYELTWKCGSNFFIHVWNSDEQRSTSSILVDNR